jgi:hypothetical protein
MPEIVGNLHLHTTTSDGTETHDEVALAAIRAGLDFIIYTDHNICVDGIEGWYQVHDGGGEILRLMGQEVNDAGLEPEHNHLLCHLITCDLTDVAADPQRLIDTVIEHNGLCFIAHPIERPGLSREDVYPWLSWDVTGFTGIELWNAMSDVKWQLRTMPRALLGAYLPNLVAWSAPFPEMLAKWDELTTAGHKAVAIGSSDVHGWTFTWGLLRRRIYAYEYLFRAVNTHLLLEESLARDAGQARDQVYHALKSGHCFVSNDLVAPARGFAFTASSGQQQASMGDTLTLHEQATLYVFSPYQAKLRLLKDGLPVAETYGQHLAWHTTEAGVYRVEAYRRFFGWPRGWVFANPIYLTPG